jgi:hypothetical protein
MRLRRIPGIPDILACCSLVVASAVPAAACTCFPPPRFEDAFAAAEAVFTGEVVKIEVIDGEFFPQEMRSRLLLENYWKGELPDTVTVYTASDEASCGFPFEMGGDYLIYADESLAADGLRLWTHLCGRSGLLQGHPDINDLGPPFTPTLNASWGSIKLLWR